MFHNTLEKRICRLFVFYIDSLFYQKWSHHWKQCYLNFIKIMCCLIMWSICSIYREIIWLVAFDNSDNIQVWYGRGKSEACLYITFNQTEQDPKRSNPANCSMYSCYQNVMKVAFKFTAHLAHAKTRHFDESISWLR